MWSRDNPLPVAHEIAAREFVDFAPGLDGTAGSPRFRRGQGDPPDATVTTDAGTFRAVMFGQRPVEDAVGSGDLRLDGHAEAASRRRGLLLTLCR